MKSRSVERFFASLPWLSAALPFVVVLFRGVPLGHDLPLEVARVAAYTYAWSDGQRPPFWAPDLYAGFGSPIFLFYGHVCVALSSLFARVAGSFSAGYVLALASASALGVFAMQRAAAELPVATSPSSVRVGVYMLLLNPYVVGDALLRNAGAEYIALCVMPLAVYGYLLCARAGSRGPLWLAAGIGLVIATHNLSALVVCALCLALLALSAAFGARAPVRLHAWRSACALDSRSPRMPGCRRSCSSSWIQSEQLTLGKFDFHRQFQPLTTLFDASTFFSPGPLVFVAAVVAARHWLARNGERALLGALLVSFCALLFVQTTASTPLWEHVPLMPLFQFPWRFMGPLALVAALLASCAFARSTAPLAPDARLRREAWVLAACVLCVLPQFARMRVWSAAEVQGFEASLARPSLRRVPMSTTVLHEYLPEGASMRGVTGPADDALIVTASDGFRIAIRKREPSSTPRST